MNRLDGALMSVQPWTCDPSSFQLTTAEILYRIPDYPKILQSFIWQKLDAAPEYPQLHEFLDFWEKNLDGSIHSVRVAGRPILEPKSLRCVDKAFVLH